MDEVVVIGYGTQKKSHLTGAISKVTNENLDQIAVPRVDDALVGQVSGVNIQQLVEKQVLLQQLELEGLDLYWRFWTIGGS